MLPAIHIAGNDGVTYVNVYRRSLSSGPETRKPKFSSIRDHARTPPSTFLFLHLHLSNSPGPEGPISHGWEFSHYWEFRKHLHRTAN